MDSVQVTATHCSPSTALYNNAIAISSGANDLTHTEQSILRTCLLAPKTVTGFKRTEDFPPRKLVITLVFPAAQTLNISPSRIQPLAASITAWYRCSLTPASGAARVLTLTFWHIYSNFS